MPLPARKPQSREDVPAADPRTARPSDRREGRTSSKARAVRASILYRVKNGGARTVLVVRVAV